MRSIWNGAISFGLVSIPIKLVNATESHSISFRQIHLADGGRIRYRKVCELDEEEVTSAEIGKAYEDADGSMIPISDDDLAQLPLPTAKTIEIVGFVPESSIDPLQLGSAYYISANGVPAAKPYTLLREALKRARRSRSRNSRCAGASGWAWCGSSATSSPCTGCSGRTRSGSRRVAPETEVSIRDAELDLADALMDTLGEVELASLHDDYREAVEELIASKAAGGGELRAPEGAGERRGGKVLDLMAALESSVRAAKESRGEGSGTGTGAGAGAGAGDGDGDHAEVTHLPARKKSAGARKTASKAASKTASKKAPAKKASAAAKKTATGRTAAKKTASATAKKTTAKKAPARKRSA